MTWAKTDHVFLEKSVLKNYHRNLGDFLLQRGSITSEELKKGLQESIASGELPGNYLLKNKIISERDLLGALAGVKNIPFIRPGHLEDYELQQYATAFDENLIRELNAYCMNWQRVLIVRLHFGKASICK